MRDKNRIKDFCDRLAKVWENECPDWRFFQLINNIMRVANNDLFYVEDDIAINLIENTFRGNE